MAVPPASDDDPPFDHLSREFEAPLDREVMWHAYSRLLNNMARRNRKRLAAKDADKPNE